MASRLAGDLGQLVVSIGTDLTDLNKGLKSADSDIKGFSKSAESSLLSFKNIAIGATAAAGAAIVALGVQTFKYGQELHKLSVQTGISAQDLARLKFIAEDVDSSFESLVGSIKFISRSMYEASTGNKELADTYKKLGIDIKNADGSLRDAKDVLFELGPATQALGNETEALAILMKLTGRGAQELQGFMKTSKEEMDRLREVNIGATNKMNEFVEVVDRLSDRMNLMNQRFKNFTAESSLPFLRWLDNATSNTRNLGEALKKLNEYMMAFGGGGMAGLASKFGQDTAFNALSNKAGQVGFLPAGMPGREGPQIAGAPGFLPAGAGSRMDAQSMAMPWESKYGTGKGQQAPAGFSEGGGQDVLGVNFGAITAKMEELQTKWKDVSAQMAESFGSSMEMITSGFGDGVATMIVDGADFGESMKNLFKDFAREAISKIVEIIAQQVILFAWQVVTGTVGSGNLMPGGGGGKKKFFGLFREGGLMPQARSGIMTGGHGEGGIPVMAHPNEIIAPIDKVFGLMQDAMGKGATYNVYPAAGMSEQSLAQKIAFENERRRRRP